tara:strand:- start:5378 stop:5683 length:306 start_codon:yes stop_codon:yes gene_type:complete
MDAIGSKQRKDPSCGAKAALGKSRSCALCSADAKEAGQDMGDVINLRQARKAKARTDKARQADVNRAKFGRTKAQRQAEDQQRARQEAAVDATYREDRAPE